MPAKPESEHFDRTYVSDAFERIIYQWRNCRAPDYTTGTPGTDRHPKAAYSQYILYKIERDLDGDTARWWYQLLPGPIKHEQEIDEEFNVPIPHTRQTVLASAAPLGQSGKRITVLEDGVRSEVWAIDLAALTTALNAVNISFGGVLADADLPLVLNSVTGYVEKHSAEGADTLGSDYASSWSGHGSAYLNLSDSAQSSASIMPDVIPDVIDPYGKKIPTMNYLFFLPLNVTNAALLAKVSALSGGSVTAWPRFKPRSVRLICRGQSGSLQVVAKANLGDGGSSDSYERSSGSSTNKNVETGLTIKGVTLPPTIHPSMAIGGTTSDSATIAAAAAIALVGTAGMAEADISEEMTVAGAILGTIAASPGPTAIPTTGKTLVDQNVRPWKWDFAICQAEILDWADV